MCAATPLLCPELIQFHRSTKSKKPVVYSVDCCCCSAAATVAACVSRLHKIMYRCGLHLLDVLLSSSHVRSCDVNGGDDVLLLPHKKLTYHIAPPVHTPTLTRTHAHTCTFSRICHFVLLSHELVINILNLHLSIFVASFRQIFFFSFFLIFFNLLFV